MEKKILKVIKKYFGLINEGSNLKDKMIIFIYFLKTPIHFIYQKLNKDYNHKLIGNVTIKSKDGIFFCGNSIFSVWTGSSFHERNLREYFKLDKGVFIDVGANIGKYSIILGKKLNDTGKVLAFEPMPEIFKILKKNIDLNNLQNIIPIEIALGDEEGYIEFYLDKENVGGGGHSLVKKTENKIKVQVKKLDNILKNLKIKNVDLIKIDVEGAEADVLKGAEKTLKKYHPRIIFEAWNEEYLDKIKKVLQPFNYKIKQIAPENYIAN